MIFRFLRYFLRDDEFEQTQNQLAEIRKTLDDIYQEQKRILQEDREKVDPGFLALVWASIAAALVMGAEATTKFPKLEIGISLTPAQIVWVIIACGAVLFTVLGLAIALRLTMDYAKSKSNSSYRVFSISLAVGILILVLGLILISLFSASTP
jgi:hypothetical protein